MKSPLVRRATYSKLLNEYMVLTMAYDDLRKKYDALESILDVLNEKQGRPATEELEDGE